jgi:hypothetical protein
MSQILQRLPDSRFSEVLPEWKDRTVILIGAGPSLTPEQVDIVKAAHEAGTVQCIAINDAYLWAPFADVLYFADWQYWLWHETGTPKPKLGLAAEQVKDKFAAFAGQKCSILYSQLNITDDKVHILQNRDGLDRHGDGLSLVPTQLATGRHSGYQALGVAALAGSKKIILVGFDGRPGKNGEPNFSGGHVRPTNPAIYEYMRKAFAAGEHEIREAGIKVLNANLDSSIECFPKVPLSEAI